MVKNGGGIAEADGWGISGRGHFYVTYFSCN